MKKPMTQSLALMCAVALSSAAWAQSNTDLPALPPDMSGEAPMPSVELPPVTQAMPEPALPPAIPQNDVPAISLPEAETPQNNTPPNTADMPPVEGVVEPVAEGAVPDEKEDFTPSYGTFENSLMYNSQSIERMKKVLYMYERVKRNEGGVPVKDDFTDLLVEVKPPVSIKEPSAYPSYHLSSIVYRSPKDWLVWIDGKKYSSKNQPPDLEIATINERSVAILWKPEYYSAVKQRFQEVALDTSIPQHFRSLDSKVRLNDKEKGVIFTLSPNQTFVSAALAVYEGKFGRRSPPPMEQDMSFDNADTPVDGIGNAPITVPSTPQTMEDKLRSTSNDLQQFNGNLRRLTPRNRVAGSPDTSTMTPTITPAPLDQPPAGAPIAVPPVPNTAN